jgi:hypothetical protein
MVRYILGRQAFQPARQVMLGCGETRDYKTKIAARSKVLNELTLEFLFRFNHLCIYNHFPD